MGWEQTRILGNPSASCPGDHAKPDRHEPEDYAAHALDYLIRSHALGEVYPAPLFSGEEEDIRQLAIACFGAFGNMALFATTERPTIHIPGKPLKLC